MVRRLKSLFGLRGAALVPWRWRLFHPSNPRWGLDVPDESRSADWHDGLADAFEVMDAQLAVRRSQLDQMRLRGSATSALDSFPPEVARPVDNDLRAQDQPPPFVERRKPRPDLVVTRDAVEPATLSAIRSSDQLSPEALDAIATRVAEKLKASMAPQPPPGLPGRRAPGRSNAAPESNPRPPLITIRIRRPFW